MNTIKIIEQNINQNKEIVGEEYVEKLDDDNFYNRVKNENADIYIFNEVIKPQHIIDGIEKICPDKYEYKYNIKDLTYTHYGKTLAQNKIMIIYDKKRFDFVESSEDMYSMENGLDFLHIMLYDNENLKEYNIIGVRFHNVINQEARDKYYESKKSKNKRDEKKALTLAQESNKKPMIVLEKLMNYAKNFKNVIIAGDFNNEIFNNNRSYKEYVNYNYHKIHEYISNKTKFRILTAGIKVGVNSEITFDEEKNWTYLIYRVPTKEEEEWYDVNMMPVYKTLDHFIVSENIICDSFGIIDNPDIESFASEVYWKYTIDNNKKNKSIKWGKPDHRMIQLFFK